MCKKMITIEVNQCFEFAKCFADFYYLAKDFPQHQDFALFNMMALVETFDQARLAFLMCDSEQQKEEACLKMAMFASGYVQWNSLRDKTCNPELLNVIQEKIHGTERITTKEFLRLQTLQVCLFSSSQKELDA